MSLTKSELKWATVLALTTVFPISGPTGIRVLEPPYKLMYNNGDEIDFDGISVAAFVGDRRWDVPRYPNGIIPFEELIFPQRYAQVSVPFDQKIWTDGRIYALKFTSNELGYIGEVGENYWFLSNEVVFSYFITQYNGNLYAAQVSENLPFIRWHYCAKLDHTAQASFPDSNIRWSRMNFVTFAASFIHDFPLDGIPESTINPLGLSASQLEAIPVSVVIPVQWRDFEAGFEIMVYP